jgi:hypothetical protein
LRILHPQRVEHVTRIVLVQLREDGLRIGRTTAQQGFAACSEGRACGGAQLV